MASVQPLYWYGSFPYRVTQDILDKSVHELEALRGQTVSVFKSSQSSNVIVRGISEVATRVLSDLYEYLAPFARPIVNNIQDEYDKVKFDPRVVQALKTLQDFEKNIEDSYSSARSSVFSEKDIEDVIDK